MLNGKAGKEEIRKGFNSNNRNVVFLNRQMVFPASYP